MAKRPGLRVIEGGTRVAGDPLSPGNAISVTLCGSSVDLFESFRGGSEQPDAIIGALFKVMTAMRVSTLGPETQNRAFVHRLGGMNASIVGVMLPPGFSNLINDNPT